MAAYYHITTSTRGASVRINGLSRKDGEIFEVPAGPHSLKFENKFRDRNNLLQTSYNINHVFQDGEIMYITVYCDYYGDLQGAPQYSVKNATQSEIIALIEKRDARRKQEAAIEASLRKDTLKKALIYLIISFISCFIGIIISNNATPIFLLISLVLFAIAIKKFFSK